MALDQHFQLSRDKEAECSGGHHMLQCRHEHVQNDVKVFNVLALRRNYLTNNVISFSCTVEKFDPMTTANY